MTDAEWLALAPGKPCRSCKREVYRLLDGQCRSCAEEKRVESEEALEKRAVKRGLRSGEIRLSDLKGPPRR